MKGSASFSFGQTIHSTLQAFYEQIRQRNLLRQDSLFSEKKSNEPSQMNNGIQVPSLEELLTLYEKYWIGDWYQSIRQRESYYKKGKDILKIFYAANEGNWTMPVALEGWFNIKVGSFPIHGRIDRIDQLPDQSLHIIDYKTGASKETLSTDDKDQLLLYQIATQTLPEYNRMGVTSKLTFYYVEDGVQTSFIGDNADLLRIKKKIEKTIVQIKEGNFSPTPIKAFCDRCDFKDICEFRA